MSSNARIATHRLAEIQMYVRASSKECMLIRKEKHPTQAQGQQPAKGRMRTGTHVNTARVQASVVQRHFQGACQRTRVTCTRADLHDTSNNCLQSP